MKTLNLIYILRIGFGILAAIIATLVVNLKAGNPIINGITVALAVYIITYYLLKTQFGSKVEKPSKILTMGIGIYFIIFAFCWILMVTPFLAPPTAQFTITTENPENPLVIGQPITFNATSSVDPDGTIVKYSWNFGDGNKGTGENVTYTYTVAGDYAVRLTVTDDHGISMTTNATTIITVKADA